MGMIYHVSKVDYIFYRFYFYFLFYWYINMADKIESLLKYAQKNPDLLAKAMSIANNNPELLKAAPALAATVKNVMNPSTGAPITGTIGSVENVASVDDVTETINTAKTFFDIKYIIIGALVIWAIIIITVRFQVKTEETKKDIEFINSTLFGNNGIVPIILSVWVLSILAITLLPAITGVLPKIGAVSESLSLFLAELPKLIPSLL